MRWVTLGRKLDSNEVSVWLQVGRGEVHVMIVNARVVWQYLACDTPGPSSFTSSCRGEGQAAKDENLLPSPIIEEAAMIVSQM